MQDLFDFVIIAINKWDGVWRGEQHLAQQFNKHGRVIYINPEKRLIENFKEIILWFFKKNHQPQEHRNIYVVQPILYIPLIRTFRFLQRLLYNLYIKAMKKYFLIKNPILFINNPIYPEMFDVLKTILNPRIICFRFSDNWSEFSLSVDSKQRIIKNCDYIIRKSDIIFAVSPYLYSVAKKIKSDNVYVLPNGVNSSILSSVQSVDISKMPIFKIKHPIFCYIGTINNRIRFDWITRVAKTRPSWSFIFIGPIMQSLKVVSELKLIKNIHLMGEVKYEDLPYYFKNSDVFLIPHYRTRATIAMDPIKLYEYFLTGRPVVATDVIDDKYNNLVYTSSEYDEFVIYLEKALNENNSSITKKRISFALENTWEERTETILEILRNFQNRN